MGLNAPRLGSKALGIRARTFVWTLVLLVFLPLQVLAQTSARKLVIIDAGHGGVDPGAIGPTGVREKDVALTFARELAARLRQDQTLEVRMTRETDDLVPLRQRSQLANRWREEGGSDRPALFISIHANASERRTVRGFETYFLSEALSEEARQVAANENAAERFESAAARNTLDFILNDLRQNLYLRESSDGAAIVQRRLGAVQPGPSRGVKQAGFVVLTGAFMPAVLVELGFFTNPEEETLLASREHARKVAVELASAVSDFFARPVGFR
jgi:N-acetylmuramoyl-L-alanine amidase